MTAILDLPLSVAMDYIIHAFEQEKERAAWDMWTGLYPNMIMGWIKFKSFEDFKAELFRPYVKRTQKTPEEIETEMLKVVSFYEKKRHKTSHL